MGHMQSDRKQQKPCNGMAALYRASQQEMGTPALDISDTVDIDIVCHISILASTSQQIASNMRFLVIHYTVLMYLRNILWVCLCLCKFTIMCNYSTIDYRCTILYAQSNQTSSKAWLLMEDNTTVYSNVNSYMFKVQYTMCFAVCFLNKWHNAAPPWLRHNHRTQHLRFFFSDSGQVFVRKRLGCLQKRLKCFFEKKTHQE